LEEPLAAHKSQVNNRSWKACYNIIGVI
jgi:hypothetical protein